MRKNFSERYGLRPTRIEIQSKSIDEALRNKLWNILTQFYIRCNKVYVGEDKQFSYLLNRLYHKYFKEPTDEIPIKSGDCIKILINYFFTCKWYDVYDFIEFIVNNHKYYDHSEIKNIINAFNITLKEELSAYRFINGYMTEITSEEEINEIEEVLNTSLKTVKIHIEAALKHYSNKEKPDYRNSIKESISAVESIIKTIVNNENGTLSSTINKLNKKIKINSDLKEAFLKLYNYTNDKDDCIRHGLMNEPNLNFEDAKFMLVACSAFINYLTVKADKSNIKLQ